MSGDKEEELLLCKKRDVTKMITMAVIAVSNFCVVSCISLLGAFYPIEAKKKGTSDTLIGMIFGCSEFVIFLTSPVMGYLSTRMSVRRLYIAGLCLFGCCDVLFGFLNLSPPGVPFIGLSFAVRMVEAVGAASCLTSSYAIAGNTYPDKIGTVYVRYFLAIGILETVTGVGFVIGPAIGSALYYAGGFGMPFWVMGGCVFLCGCASCSVLPSQEYIHDVTGPSRLKLYQSPLVWFGSISITVATFGLGTYVPVYTEHLLQLDFNPDIIGVAFSLPSCVYSLTAPFWGYLVDTKIPVLPLMLISLCGAAISYMFYAPAPFLTFLPVTIWLTLLMSGILGLFVAPVMICGIKCVVEGARELGFSDTGTTFGLVSGVIQSSTAVGSFLGPLFGGLATEYLGFGWAMTAAGFVHILPVMFFSPLWCARVWRRLKPNSVITDKQDYIMLKGNVSEINRISLESSPE